MIVNLIMNLINKFRIITKLQYSNNPMSQQKESLLQYQQPTQVYGADSLSGSRPKNANQMFDSKLAIDQLLNSMFPPVLYDSEGKAFKKIISTNPPSREDVNTLQKMLDEKLVYRQARDSGICPIRQQLHRQCFDEIIRQVTIDSPERGILLMRVRDQLYMTIQAYETLYQSSLTFSMRKQLQSQQGTPELQTQIRQLEQRKETLEERAEQLRKKKEISEKEIKDRKLIEDKKRAEQIDFLKYQANHLQNFLRSVNQSNK